MAVTVSQKDLVGAPIVHCFFQKSTNTCSYIVEDPKTKHAAIIDSALDYSLNSGKVNTEFADLMIGYINDKNLIIDWILDTHIHADHLSAANYFKIKIPNAKKAISENICSVQKNWADILNLKNFPTDGSQWDYLLKESDQLKIGELEMKIIHTPGHTPSCATFIVGDSVFSGDALLHPDFGTARCDFPGGSPSLLYHSLIEKIYSIPESHRLFVGHDYPPADTEVRFESTIGSSKYGNKFLKFDTPEHEFIEIRTKRDKTLDVPQLLYPAIQVNLNAGVFPKAEDNGSIYLKVPIQFIGGLKQ